MKFILRILSGALSIILPKLERYKAIFFSFRQVIEPHRVAVIPGKHVVQTNKTSIKLLLLLFGRESLLKQLFPAVLEFP